MADTLKFVPVRESLATLLGRDYIEAVLGARAALTGVRPAALRAAACARVEFYPAAMQRAQGALLARLGERVCPPLRGSAAGATTQGFALASKPARAPLSGYGCFRVGEDGRLCLASKSEHYHAPVGHSFPGYALLEHARRLGIPNATHNNTRGHVTRLLEEALVRVANGLPDGAAVGATVASGRAGVLNRVLNLETGSLACEAALKMMLGRFYRAQADSPAPKYAGRVPVFVVLGNDAGGLQANYHGTTLLAQALRGMWPELRRAGERGGAFRVVAVRPNRLDDVAAALARWDRGPYKVAGLLHELVLMNYGALVLEPRLVQRVYALCRRHDVPTLCDEIQSCLWAPQGFLFREYGIRPDFVAAGKGFPGGEYPASRLLLNARHDCLPQFGALVTNGQEELASLAYLITLRWAAANAGPTAAAGERFAERLKDLAARHPARIAQVTGLRHLQGIHFRDVAEAKALAARLQAGGLDISVQSYKTEVPPVALLKLPLIADRRIVDAVADRIAAALEAL